MNIHLLVKFQHYAWNQDNTEIKTIDEHMRLSQKKGKVCWGRVTSISQHKIDKINNQIDDGVKTYMFLYETWVPKQTHKDTNRWYIAEVDKVYPGPPKERDLIPEYYRDSVKLQTSFIIKNIKPINFAEDTTPKVPGQAAIRYCTFEGKPDPWNLKSFDTSEPMCIARNENAAEHFKKMGQQPASEITEKQMHPQIESSDFKEDLIQAQSQIIELQQEIINLREYKELYKKILDTDYLFSPEKFFENWIEDNIHKILPEIEIIDRQPTVTWPDGKFGRLDLLGKNKETNDVVIIEVKTRKRRIKTGYDQFIRYTSWVKRNREQLNQKYASVNLNVSAEPEFVIVSDYSNDEMKAICDDHGIKLVKIFGGLGFERVS